MRALDRRVGGGSQWPAADLQRRLLQSLRIAHRAVQLLGATGFQDKETGRGFSPDKVVSETSLLLMASATLVSTDRAGLLSVAHDRLARALIPFARSERVRAAICIRPAASGELSFAHTCLTSLGYPDAQFEDLVEAARSSEAVASRERLPHRMMEQEWIHRAVDRSLESTPGLARLSLLGLGVDALASTRDDTYAFTHAVMYLTDFGALRSRLPRTWAAIEADAVASLAFSLDAQDYDLAGEVLLTWPLLRRAWSPAATFGFHLLTQVEDEAGFLPPPGITADTYARLSGTERSTVVLADVYHTACVMGLLSIAALREGCAPPATIAGTGRYQGDIQGDPRADRPVRRCATRAALERTRTRLDPRPAGRAQPAFRGDLSATRGDSAEPPDRPGCSARRRQAWPARRARAQAGASAAGSGHASRRPRGARTPGQEWCRHWQRNRCIGAPRPSHYAVIETEWVLFEGRLGTQRVRVWLEYRAGSVVLASHDIDPGLEQVSG